MDKDIKNEIPENVRLRLDDTYKNILEDNIEINKNNKFSMGKRSLVRISTAVASIVVILGIGIYNPSLAEGIPILGEMLDKINYALQNNSQFKNNIDEINESSYYDGLTITVNKAMYDGNQVYVDFTFKTDKPFKDTEYNKCIDNSWEDGRKTFSFNFPDFEINAEKNTGYSFEYPKVEFVDDYTLKGSTIFEFGAISDIDNDTINFKMDLKLRTDEEDADGKSKKLDGVWSFDFPIKSNKKDTTAINVNKTKGDFTLHQVLLTPMSISIDITAPKEYYETFDIMEAVEVKDNKGNILWAKTGNYHNNEDNIDKPRYKQRYDLMEISDNIEYINVTFYGKWDEKTKSSLILADFKVDLNK
ncbi:MAG: DUF4179 domain-containing protein [Romboutsia sp.]|uniref:DUF4179 domain-containing protein n=1 Tax=Romboutsia sp. TaxID=1965302 RepID=UPI003F3FF956